MSSLVPNFLNILSVRIKKAKKLSLTPYIKMFSESMTDLTQRKMKKYFCVRIKDQSMVHASKASHHQQV